MSDKDIIYRQAAIDATNKAFDRETLLNRFVRKVAIDAIKQLPSAQPEIKCIANITLTDEQVKEAFEKARCNILAAQSERKKGKWVNGKCDQCGGHAPFWPMASTYYRSRFCPNCGAKMEEDDE